MKKGLKITLLTLVGLGLISSTIYAVEQATNHGISDSIKDIFNKEENNSSTVKEVVNLKYDDFSAIPYNNSMNGKTVAYYEYDFDYSKEYLIDSSKFVNLSAIGNLDYSSGLSNVPRLCESSGIDYNVFPFTGEFNGCRNSRLLQIIPNSGIYSLSFISVKDSYIPIFDYSQTHDPIVNEEESTTSSVEVTSSITTSSSSITSSSSENRDVIHF